MNFHGLGLVAAEDVASANNFFPSDAVSSAVALLKSLFQTSLRSCGYGVGQNGGCYGHYGRVKEENSDQH